MPPIGSAVTPQETTMNPFSTPVLRAIVALLVACGLAVSCGESSNGDSAGSGSAGATSDGPLELDLGESNAMASCLAVDVATLAEMAPAFKGTVTDVEAETITLDVDTWYAGADPAETVRLRAPQGLEALIGGIDFQVGEQYLITAADGSVNYCGYSGPADETLTALFDAAFGT